MPGCENLILKSHSTDTKLWYSNIHYINESRQSVQRTQVSNFKSTQRAMQVGWVFFFSPLDTVSRAYRVQKACAAYCLFETHNQGKSNVYTAFSWRNSTKTDKGNSPHSACWDCAPPECALDGNTKTGSSSAPLWRIVSLFSLSAWCSSYYKWPSRQLIRVFLFRKRVLLPP